MNYISAVPFITVACVDPTQWRLCYCTVQWLYKHCHCPNSWKRQDYEGKEEEQALRAGRYGKAETGQPTKQGPQHGTTLWKVPVKAVILLPACSLIIVSVV